MGFLASPRSLLQVLLLAKVLHLREMSLLKTTSNTGRSLRSILTCKGWHSLLWGWPKPWVRSKPTLLFLLRQPKLPCFAGLCLKS